MAATERLLPRIQAGAVVDPAKLAAQRRMPIAVIYYHRIAHDAAIDCTIPNRTFIDQIEWLRRNFDLISMEEVQRRIRSGVNDRSAVHITFDDGYAANHHVAIPWLIKNGIPCTYFVTVQNILQQRPFDHDLRHGLNLAPNSLDEIRAMADGGIEFGAHTYSHPDLGKLTDPDKLQHELVAARDELSTAIGRPIRYFSFPFGMHENLSCRAFALARSAAMRGFARHTAVTTTRATIRSTSIASRRSARRYD